MQSTVALLFTLVVAIASNDLRKTFEFKLERITVKINPQPVIFLDVPQEMWNVFAELEPISLRNITVEGVTLAYHP